VPSTRLRARRALAGIASALAVSALVAGPAAIDAAAFQTPASPAQPAAAADPANPYARGPAPSLSSIQATRGPYATSSTTVSRFGVSGFGGGTIYYPTTTADGTFGAVAISPGYTARQSSIAWLGPRLASQGFVVFTIDTNSVFDQPASRGDQLLAALDYLTGSSSVRTRIDPNRLGVMGHSMGGGGSLEAAKDRTTLRAAIPLTGWNLDKTWPEVVTPTLVVGAENDSVAPVGSHSIPFYTGLSSAPEKAYLELNNATHLAPTISNTTIAMYSISWLKRFVDDDTRYDQFLCPGPGAGAAISDWRTTCPF
jgi:predicted dienelactone hydrolase